MTPKLLKKCCDTCEFYFGTVEEAEKMFPNGCEDYGISLTAFIEQEKMNGR